MYLAFSISLQSLFWTVAKDLSTGWARDLKLNWATYRVWITRPTSHHNLLGLFDSQTHPHALHSSTSSASSPALPLRPFRQDGTRGPFPEPGEFVMFRLSFSMRGPASIIPESAISSSTGANYYPCVIARITNSVDDWSVEVYICRWHSSESDGVAYANSLPESARIPLPFHHPDRIW